jgi:anti-anti-sigma factor
MSTSVSTEPHILDVSEERESGRVCVRLRDELDLSNADAVTQLLDALRERRAPVLLDLDDLTFIDASGLRVVVTAASEARSDGWEFAVTRGSRQVRRLFGLLEIDKDLPYDGAPS